MVKIEKILTLGSENRSSNMTYTTQKTHLANRYPTVEDLAEKARRRLPPVAWAYLQSGTGRERLLDSNRAAFDSITLTPRFCKGPLRPDLSTTLLGNRYAAPFGIAPIGLTGLMWPRIECFLANTAREYQLPYTLSTVATETPETIGPVVGNMGWFQLYPPKDKEVRQSLLHRAREAGFHTLLVTADVPMASRRERTRRAGLKMPPRIGPRLIWQGLTHPAWSFATLRRGLPRLRTIEAYTDYKNMQFVSGYVGNRLGGTLDWDYCQTLKAEWDGPVVLKGILHPADAEKAVSIGLDGVLVSNHGGRQFDGAPAALEALPDIVRAVGNRTTILFDSGVRSGLDILRALSLGADFVLLGRAFVYGVAALGRYGGHYVTELLLDDLKNNMVQLGIEDFSEF